MLDWFDEKTYYDYGKIVSDARRINNDAFLAKMWAAKEIAIEILNHSEYNTNNDYTLAYAANRLYNMMQEGYPSLKTTEQYLVLLLKKEWFR